MFQRSTLRSPLAILLFAVLSGPALSASEVIDLADIKPEVCGDPFEYDASKKSCKVNAEKLKVITELRCGGPGLTWKDGKCEAVLGKEPKPGCGSKLPDLVVKEGKCVVERAVARSAHGQYIGDCFKIVAVPRQNTMGIEAGERLMVLSQRDDGDDRLLQVTTAKLSIPYFCSTVGPDIREVRASHLQAAGAERLGWTYGVLAMPFKYYRHDRSFGSGASIGPYVGRRSGAAGSAITFAVAATIGSVKGEVKDAGGIVTGTPDLMAFSLAAGWMYDISKAPGVKPFKIGVFFGQDRVGRDNAVSYKQNGRGWAAFQIGFDFTDN